MHVNRRSIAAVGVTALALAGVAQAWSAMAAPRDPQLTLRLATNHVYVERAPDDPYIWAALGTYVGVTNGPLHIEAMPADDGNADLWLVPRDKQGKITRDRKLATPTRGPMYLGLTDFLDVSMSSYWRVPLLWQV